MQEWAVRNAERENNYLQGSTHSVVNGREISRPLMSRTGHQRPGPFVFQDYQETYRSGSGSGASAARE